MMDQLQFVPLDNASLIGALKKECEAVGHRTGARVDFRLGELPSSEVLPPGAHQAIFRAAQEALSNVARHARASVVTVSLDSLDMAVRLQIVDDGTGFLAAQIRRGMGISNIRQRAEEFDGTVILESTPGGGTSVMLTIPWANQKIRRKPVDRGWNFAFRVIGLIVVVECGLIIVKEFRSRQVTFLLYLGAGLMIGQLSQVLTAHRRRK